ISHVLDEVIAELSAVIDLKRLPQRSSTSCQRGSGRQSLITFRTINDMWPNPDGWQFRMHPILFRNQLNGLFERAVETGRTIFDECRSDPRVIWFGTEYSH